MNGLTPIEEPWRGVAIDASSGIPIWVQLKTQFEYAIAAGRVPNHTRLPSVRALSRGLGVAIDTVRQAYDALSNAGLIETIRGTGTFTLLNAPTTALSDDRGTWAEVDEALAELLTAPSSPAMTKRALRQRLAMLQHGITIGFVGDRAAVDHYTDKINSALPPGIAAVTSIAIDQLRDGNLRACDGVTHLITLAHHSEDLQTLLVDRPARILPIIPKHPTATAEHEKSLTRTIEAIRSDIQTLQDLQRRIAASRSANAGAIPPQKDQPQPRRS